MTEALNEIDRYISEAVRVRRAVQVYDELFCSKESVAALIDTAGEVFGVMQRALHDEILISFSRLFDSDGYKTKNGTQAYLSQLNIVKRHESLLTDDLKNLRERTTCLWKKLDLKKYRDLKVAHNDKAIFFGKSGPVKHGITSDLAKELLDVSIRLMISLKREITRSEKVALPVNPQEAYQGKGLDLIGKLKGI
jgi:hypothetical protein|tara:strand:+ start:67 stop:648 length:582 start_codon:yes stop_codon:yes gene_type:complete